MVKKRKYTVTSIAILECLLLTISSLTILGETQQVCGPASGKLLPSVLPNGQGNGSVSFIRDDLNFTFINSTSFKSPAMGAVNYWNNKIYVANLYGTSVSVINPSNYSVSTAFNLSRNPAVSLAFSKSGQTLYLLNEYQLSIINLTTERYMANISVPFSFFITCNPANGNILIPSSGNLTIVSQKNYSVKTVHYASVPPIAGHQAHEQVIVDQNSNRIFMVTSSQIIVINASTYQVEANITDNIAGNGLLFFYSTINIGHNLIYFDGRYNQGGTVLAAYNLTTLTLVLLVYQHAFALQDFYWPNIAYDSKDNAVFLATNGYNYAANVSGPPVSLVVLNGSAGHIMSEIKKIPYEQLSPLPNDIIYDRVNGLVYVFMVLPDNLNTLTSGNVVSITITGNGTFGPSLSDVARAQLLRYVGEGLSALAVVVPILISYSYIESQSMRKKP